MVTACRETSVSLVGGEIAEMPDTYLPGEHDLVGVITGVVDKEKIIDGKSIKRGDSILGIPSNGLHTNGYSLARKLFFDVGKYDVRDEISGLEKPIGITLLEPHINYTNHIKNLISNDIEIKGIAHITGGGLIENIPRILPSIYTAKIDLDTWPILPIFKVMQSIGSIDDKEMFRAFNMGVGMVLIVDPKLESKVIDLISPLSPVFKIGDVISGNGEVIIA